MPTITDIARDCGVSIATVSMVINNKGRVGTDTRNRVMDAVHRLNYDLDAKRPRPLPTKTDTIGLVLPRPLEPREGFYYRAVLSAQTRCLEYGYDCKILTQQEVSLRAVGNFYKGKGQLGCDAVLLFCPTVGWEQLVTNLRAWDVPLAVVRRQAADRGTAYLMDDDAAGGRLAGTHLTSLGHRRMAALTGTGGGDIPAMRIRAAAAAMGQDVHTVPQLRLHRDGGIPVTELKDLMNAPDPVTALFAVGDALAAHAVRELSRAGIRIPEQLSVIGYDDDPEASMAFPTLTTVRIPVEEMVAAACRALARYTSDDEQIATTLNFSNELVVRESTGAVTSAE